MRITAAFRGVRVPTYVRVDHFLCTLRVAWGRGTRRRAAAPRENTGQGRSGGISAGETPQGAVLVYIRLESRNAFLCVAFWVRGSVLRGLQYIASSRQARIEL